MGRNYKGIDARSIDCACGHPDCIAGLSFDYTGNFGVLRFHYPDEIETTDGKTIKHQAEYPMKVTVETIDQIIERLTEMKSDLINP
ncbi:MAG: hypothetical protein RBT49_15565 [Bacteroidales bacterium]|jgi:hypothetical protein|nr:hypothetical protein [Bacteroidales bacterium]